MGGDAGVLFALTSRVGFGVQTGLRYLGKLTDVDGLAGTGLENLNDVGDRWSVPVTSLLRVRF